MSLQRKNIRTRKGSYPRSTTPPFGMPYFGLCLFIPVLLGASPRVFDFAVMWTGSIPPYEATQNLALPCSSHVMSTLHTARRSRSDFDAKALPKNQTSSCNPGINRRREICGEMHRVAWWSSCQPQQKQNVPDFGWRQRIHSYLNNMAPENAKLLHLWKVMRW